MTGVYRNPLTGKWTVQIGGIHLGTFAFEADARQAREAAEAARPVRRPRRFRLRQTDSGKWQLYVRSCYIGTFATEEEARSRAETIIAGQEEALRVKSVAIAASAAEKRKHNELHRR